MKDLEQGIADEEAASRQAGEAKADATGIEGGADVNALLFRLPGQAGLVIGAPGGDGPKLSGGELTTGSAWSTIKVPIAERVLADFGGPGGISATQSEQIRQAIAASDNEAAAALFADLEAEHGGLAGASEAVGQMLRDAGDGGTAISTQGRDGFSTQGQTRWSLVQQNRYMAALTGDCISDSASRSFLLGQTAEVTAEPWGLGAAGEPAKWKGGWEPGTNGRYRVRQMGVIEAGGTQVVVNMAAVADGGTFETGQQILSRIAKWTAFRLADQVGPPQPCG